MSIFFSTEFLIVEVMVFAVGFVIARTQTTADIRSGVILYAALLVSVPISILGGFESRGFALAGWKVGVLFFIVSCVSGAWGVAVSKALSCIRTGDNSRSTSESNASSHLENNIE